MRDVATRYPIHERKRLAVATAMRALEEISLGFWREEEADVPQDNLHKELLHLAALREEVLTSAETLLEVDELIVACKATADSMLEEALKPMGASGASESGASAAVSFATYDVLQALKAGATPLDARSWTRMSRDWKMLLYSVRCFQDCVYRAVLCIHRQKPGQGSMSPCMKAEKSDGSKPVRSAMDRHVPGYRDWFVQMRDLRNELKRGLSVRSDWRAGEHVIILYEPYPDGVFVGGKNLRPLSLDFASQCLSMCAAAAIAIRAELQERGAPPSTEAPAAV